MSNRLNGYAIPVDRVTARTGICLKTFPFAQNNNFTEYTKRSARYMRRRGITDMYLGFALFPSKWRKDFTWQLYLLRKEESN